MPQVSPNLASAPWPLLVIGAWIITVMVVAALIYAISKAAINKSDAADLPQVLTALAPLLGGMAAVFTGPPHQPSAATPIGITAAPASPEAAHTEENETREPEAA